MEGVLILFYLCFSVCKEMEDIPSLSEEAGTLAMWVLPVSCWTLREPI